MTTNDSIDVAALVKDPLPKHTDFSSLLARWHDAARRLGRERERSASRGRKTFAGVFRSGSFGAQMEEASDKVCFFSFSFILFVILSWEITMTLW